MKPDFAVFPRATCMGYPPCHARVVLAVEDDGLVPIVYWGMPGRPTARLAPAEALPYAANCREHRAPMLGKPLRGLFGTAACNEACTSATGGECHCRCGGLHHGEDT